ncbi:MAG: hypothetical protein KJ675_15530 [Gammaproteobacteria bacterium]|nr:hypothetical protein [Gammaproteobacteria bacterium]MBU1962574.1 hypothetical protein [Gammaproteobacteria bacterium]
MPAGDAPATGVPDGGEKQRDKALLASQEGDFQQILPPMRPHLALFRQSQDEGMGRVGIETLTCSLLDRCFKHTAVGTDGFQRAGFAICPWQDADPIPECMANGAAPGGTEEGWETTALGCVEQPPETAIEIGFHIDQHLCLFVVAPGTVLHPGAVH